jgi:hypothetical protein
MCLGMVGYHERSEIRARVALGHRLLPPGAGWAAHPSSVDTSLVGSRPLWLQARAPHPPTPMPGIRHG